MTIYRSTLVSTLKVNEAEIECYMLSGGEIRYSVDDVIRITQLDRITDYFDELLIRETETLYINRPSGDCCVGSLSREMVEYLLLCATLSGHFKSSLILNELLYQNLYERADEAFVRPIEFTNTL